ncbi:unnamed protein product [Rhizophagus irregularis]|uniref:Uncharacterized protein n=1 Tax=Rhizophagus irregularis TaxID=588596 RepID=A0A2N1N3D1_9GLOM|nr:hypothetical protein RhiirC2_782300 [Rhizophagus irregularis]CAB4377093.1 unnamed protein product [Rhizophagus irregularis]CAB5382192.1 unnamed protein product [Rhizophagus irregularis]
MFRHIVGRNLSPIKRYSTNVTREANKDDKMKNIVTYAGVGAFAFLSFWGMFHTSITALIRPVDRILEKLDAISDDVSSIKEYFQAGNWENRKTGN